MLKTLTAALVAASVLIAPMASVTANAAPATRSATITTKTVKLVKHHKRHVVKHHKRHKHVKHVRHFKKHSMQTRHGKLVRAHKHSHIVLVKPRVRAN